MARSYGVIWCSPAANAPIATMWGGLAVGPGGICLPTAVDQSCGFARHLCLGSSAHRLDVHDQSSHERPNCESASSRWLGSSGIPRR
jgi:hypothetical protein